MHGTTPYPIARMLFVLSSCDPLAFFFSATSPTRYTAVMRRWLRYLRIAFSTACLIACVVLIALWVRSYWWNIGIYRNSNAGLAAIVVNYGSLKVATQPAQPASIGLTFNAGWQYQSYRLVHHIRNTNGFGRRQLSVSHFPLGSLRRSSLS